MLRNLKNQFMDDKNGKNRHIFDLSHVFLKNVEMPYYRSLFAKNAKKTGLFSTSNNYHIQICQKHQKRNISTSSVSFLGHFSAKTQHLNRSVAFF